MEKCEIVLQLISIGVDAIVGFLTFFTLRAAIKANKEANNANTIARQANEIANEANLYAKVELKNSIDSQIHSKNIELFEKRLNILKIIDNVEISAWWDSVWDSKNDITINDINNLKIDVKLLFNNDSNIVKLFDSFYNLLCDMKNCISDYETWIRHLVRPDNYGGIDESIKQKVLNLEIEVDNHPDDNELKERYINLCNSSSFTETYGEETITYNYNEISNRHAKIANSFKDNKKRLTELMKTFITISIEDNKK